MQHRSFEGWWAWLLMICCVGLMVFVLLMAVGVLPFR